MTLAERAQALGAGGGEGHAPTATLARLKEDVRLFVSVDDIAALMAFEPARARSELLGACRQAFALPVWQGADALRRSRLSEQLIDEVFGFGPLQPLLADPTITEIMVNGPGDVFFERQGRLVRSDRAFSSQAQLRALIDRVLGPLGRRVDESSPMVNARMPEGHRVHVVIPPLAPDGPIVTIRKFTQRVITLQEMERFGSIDGHLRRFLEWAVLARKNVVVAGGTGSGKTTLLNALSCCIPAGERIVTIEDTAELRFLEHPHVVRLEARPRNAEGAGEVTIRELVINALRMRPDRIVVGECRGAEAVDMLTAMNTGHDGSLTTLHANSPRGDHGPLRRRSARGRDRGERGKRVRCGGADVAGAQRQAMRDPCVGACVRPKGACLQREDVVRAAFSRRSGVVAGPARLGGRPARNHRA
ncbi:CpaF family protein [Senegalimassilia anaerobia]|uniref:CpaF family protein n=1 Tax=Senegalimassilia anaerobia TaxID=1473216 RepID=UPI003A8CAA29